MKQYRTEYITAEDILYAGDWILNKSSDTWHLILKVKAEGFLQNAWDGKFGTQSRRDNTIAQGRVVLYDGRFCREIDREEINTLYHKVYHPNYVDPIPAFLTWPI